MSSVKTSKKVNTTQQNLTKSGNRAIGLNSFWRNPRFSILGALNADGIVHYAVVEGAINGRIFFEWFLQYLLPNLNPYPQEKSVLILDNVALHKFAPFHLVAQFVGIRILYLPPYTPWLNTIELWFQILKNNIRRMGFEFTRNVLRNIILTIERNRRVDFRNAIRRIGYYDHIWG